MITAQWLPLTDAAPALGISVYALRRRVRLQKIASRKVPSSHGGPDKYEVLVDGSNRLAGHADVADVPVADIVCAIHDALTKRTLVRLRRRPPRLTERPRTGPTSPSVRARFASWARLVPA